MNWLDPKNRARKTSNHLRIVARSYCRRAASGNSIGQSPFRRCRARCARRGRRPSMEAALNAGCGRGRSRAARRGRSWPRCSGSARLPRQEPARARFAGEDRLEDRVGGGVELVGAGPQDDGPFHPGLSTGPSHAPDTASVVVGAAPGARVPPARRGSPTSSAGSPSPRPRNYSLSFSHGRGRRRNDSSPSGTKPPCHGWF